MNRMADSFLPHNKSKKKSREYILFKKKDYFVVYRWIKNRFSNTGAEVFTLKVKYFKPNGKLTSTIQTEVKEDVLIS